MIKYHKPGEIIKLWEKEIEDKLENDDYMPKYLHGVEDRLKCAHAVRWGDIKTLQWLMKKNYHIDEYAFFEAVRGCNFRVIEFLLEKSFLWGNDSRGGGPAGFLDIATGVAAARGDLNVLKFLVQRGFRCSRYDFFIAQTRGHVHIADWLSNSLVVM